MSAAHHPSCIGPKEIPNSFGAPLTPSSRKIEVVVQGANGTRALCAQEWLICALKVMLVVVCVGALMGTSVYAFGAAGVFGSTIAHAMGVSVTNISLVMGVLCTAGGILIAQTVACVRLAHKHKMNEYTGNDLEDAHKFLVESAEKIYGIVKDIFIARLNDLIDILSEVEDVENEKGSVFKHVVHEVQQLEETAASKETKRRVRMVLKSMRFGEPEKESKKKTPVDREKLIGGVISDLEEEGRRGVKKDAPTEKARSNGVDTEQLIDAVITHLKCEARKNETVKKVKPTATNATEEVVEACSPKSTVISKGISEGISDLGRRKVRAVVSQSVNELLADRELLKEILTNYC